MVRFVFILLTVWLGVVTAAAKGMQNSDSLVTLRGTVKDADTTFQPAHSVGQARSGPQDPQAQGSQQQVYCQARQRLREVFEQCLEAPRRALTFCLP